MKLTFEEACMAVADLFEACPEMWTNDLAELDDDNCRFCVVTGVNAALDVDEMPPEAHTILYGIAKDLGFVNISSGNHTRESGIKLLRIASGELKP